MKFYTVEEYESAFLNVMDNLDILKAAVSSWREEYPTAEENAYWMLVDVEVKLYEIDELLFGKDEEE